MVTKTLKLSPMAGELSKIFRVARMRLFKKETPQFGADDVKATQDVVQSITEALKTGAEQQDLAAKRLNALTKSMAKMDANVRHVARLQAETERLGSETTKLRGDLDKKRAWAQEQI